MEPGLAVGQFELISAKNLEPLRLAQDRKNQRHGLRGE